MRWYVAYPISYSHLEEMMEERGVKVDHSSLNRWVINYALLLDEAFRARKRRVGGDLRMDETYVRIKGRWKYLYRAADKTGYTVDFLLTAKRDRKAALRFLCKAVGQHGTPAKITTDGSGTPCRPLFESADTRSDGLTPPAGYSCTKAMNTRIEAARGAGSNSTRP